MSEAGTDIFDELAAPDSVLISALQKAIRRCERDKAIAYAAALLRRSSAENGGDTQRRLRLWRRLSVIATEDIGVAARGVLSSVRVQRESEERCDALRKQNKRGPASAGCAAAPELLRPRNARMLTVVAALAECPKSRLTDHAYISLHQKPESVDISSRDAAATKLWETLPQRNERGAICAVAAAHRLKCSDVVFDTVRALLYSGDDANIDHDSKLELGELEALKSAYSDDQCVLYLVHAVLLVTRPRPPSREVACRLERTQGMKAANSEVVFLVYSAGDEADSGSVSNLSSIYTSSTLPPFDDYVFDKHTTKGRAMGRGMLHFLEHSCVLNRCSIEDGYMQDLMEQYREEDDGSGQA
jgi:hypothetical protein